MPLAEKRAPSSQPTDCFWKLTKVVNRGIQKIKKLKMYHGMLRKKLPIFPENKFGQPPVALPSMRQRFSNDVASYIFGFV